MKELEKIIPSDRILYDVEKKYIYDDLIKKEGKVDAVVFPISTEEVSKIVSFCYQNDINITPRGIGTNLAGSTFPLFGGIIVDMSKMNRLLEIDEETFTATVESGVLLRDLRTEAEKHGLFYPPDPGEKGASIAGNIATNAGGMRAVKYGTTRDFVRSSPCSVVIVKS
jgi:glycolate oxidase